MVVGADEVAVGVELGESGWEVLVGEVEGAQEADGQDEEANGEDVGDVGADFCSGATVLVLRARRLRVCVLASVVGASFSCCAACVQVVVPWAPPCAVRRGVVGLAWLVGMRAMLLGSKFSAGCAEVLARGAGWCQRRPVIFRTCRRL